MMKLVSRYSLGLVGLLAGLSLGHAATVQVSIVGNSFVPKVVTVQVGDTVAWSNGQNVHTVSPNGGLNEPFCGGFAIISCSHVFTNTGSFAYHCNFHEYSHSMTGQVIVVNAPTNSLPPTVAITGLVENALFAAPASFNAGVNASDPDGSVVSVAWQTNGVNCVVSGSAPFAFTAGGLAAGNYALRAVATDSQSLSATSAPVNVRVVQAPVLRLELVQSGTGQCLFQTVPGLNYIIESATVLPAFTPQATNAGNGTVQNVFVGMGGGQKFFRLRLE
jgi:plastocyanin